MSIKSKRTAGILHFWPFYFDTTEPKFRNDVPRTVMTRIDSERLTKILLFRALIPALGEQPHLTRIFDFVIVYHQDHFCTYSLWIILISHLNMIKI